MKEGEELEMTCEVVFFNLSNWVDIDSIYWKEVD